MGLAVAGLHDICWGLRELARVKAKYAKDLRYARCALMGIGCALGGGIYTAFIGVDVC